MCPRRHNTAAACHGPRMLLGFREQPRIGEHTRDRKASPSWSALDWAVLDINMLRRINIGTILTHLSEKSQPGGACQPGLHFVRIASKPLGLCRAKFL